MAMEKIFKKEGKLRWKIILAVVVLSLLTWYFVPWGKVFTKPETPKPAISKPATTLEDLYRMSVTLKQDNLELKAKLVTAETNHELLLGSINALTQKVEECCKCKKPKAKPVVVVPPKVEEPKMVPTPTKPAVLPAVVPPPKKPFVLPAANMPPCSGCINP